MNQLLHRIFLLLLALCFGAAPSARAEAAPDVHALADDVIALNLQQADAASVQDWISGTLAESAGTGTEWYAIALSQRGDYDLSAYRASLRRYLDSATVSSASSRLKFALALAATGGGDPYITRTMDDAIGQQGVMSWVYGLHLINNGYTSTVCTAQDALDKLLSLQLEDGGWAVTGKVSDVDVTAMVVQALALHRDNADVQSAVDAALTLLSARQMEDGGYSSYGTPNPESAAQVLIALSALGIDGLQDERFIKGGYTILDAIASYRLPDGSFSHTIGGTRNMNATMQVFFACTAYERLLAGQSGIYVLDPHEALAASPLALTGYRPIAAAVILLLALIACVALLVMKKRHWKNYLAVLLLAGILLALVFTLDIQSADSYYSGQPVVKDNPVGSVTLSIRCDSVAGKTAYIPADGVMLPETVFPIAQGDTVFTILTDAAQSTGLRLDNSGGQGMAYIAGINGLYEFAHGDLSGWTYLVNGESPSVGCDHYILQDGDAIQWLYTLTMGRSPE